MWFCEKILNYEGKFCPNNIEKSPDFHHLKFLVAKYPLKIFKSETQIDSGSTSARLGPFPDSSQTVFGILIVVVVIHTISTKCNFIMSIKGTKL